MDPRHSAQDVTRCDLCETAIAQMYCDFCHVNLCIACIGKHIADDYDKHKVVPIGKRKSTLIYPTCSTHENEVCKVHCNECDESVCSLCTANLLTSGKHKGHSCSVLSEVYHKRKADIANDSEEIKNIISLTYEEMAANLETRISKLDVEYEKLTTAFTKHGEEWHKEIDNVINRMKHETEEMKIKHLEILQKQLDEIKQIQSLIEQSLITLKEMEESNEVSVTMKYRSKNQEFRRLPPKVRVSLPTFNPNAIDSEQLYKSLGSWIPLSFTTDENGYTLEKTEASPKELMDEPELATTVNAGYERLRSVTCLNEEEFWTSALNVSDMKCFNIQGTVINTIKTKSGKWPRDIAVTSDGELVYSDETTKTVNKVKNGQTEEMIRLQGWKPNNLCVTSSGDLLVTMRSDDNTQSKVVRYSGSTEKQTIQYDDEGKPLYSGNDIKYISENRNQDICVADWGAGAVVVVNQAGKLRFKYTGHSSTVKNKLFNPYGITTDSQSQILTADFNNHCIHILDQNGQFLRYIENCDLKRPWGLSIDKSDNLLVAEYCSGNVKKIKYLQ